MPGDPYPRIARVEGLWSELPSDGLPRKFLRCRRFYRPQETIFAMGPSASGAPPQIFSSDHVEESVTLQSVSGVAVVHMGPPGEGGEGSAGAASGAARRKEEERRHPSSRHVGGKGSEGAWEVEEFCCSFHYDRLAMTLGVLPRDK